MAGLTVIPQTGSVALSADLDFFFPNMGVLSLGVFSGIASSCCAPVLAGVMTLSALSGSAVGGLLLGFANVFGMVIPLFVMALLGVSDGLCKQVSSLKEMTL